MVLGLQELMSALFHETDRAQRMKMPLALLKVAIIASSAAPSDPVHPHGAVTLQCFLGQIACLLRCYDSVGQVADDELLLLLPGCSLPNAVTMAERLRDEVFGPSSAQIPSSAQLQACYAIVSSGGRSPVVVLREVDRLLENARAEGHGAIQCVSPQDDMDPSTFLLPVLQDESLRW